MTVFAYLGDAPGSVGAGHRVAEVNHSGEVGVLGVLGRVGTVKICIYFFTQFHIQILGQKHLYSQPFHHHFVSHSFRLCVLPSLNLYTSIDH